MAALMDLDAQCDCGVTGHTGMTAPVHAFNCATRRLAHSEPRPVAGADLAHFILGLEVTPVTVEHAGARNGKELIRAKQAARQALATHSPAPTEAGEVERARTIARHMVEACGELANSTKYDASDRALWGSAEADAQEIFDLLSSTQGGAEA